MVEAKARRRDGSVEVASASELRRWGERLGFDGLGMAPTYMTGILSKSWPARASAFWMSVVDMVGVENREE